MRSRRLTDWVFVMVGISLTLLCVTFSYVLVVMA